MTMNMLATAAALTDHALLARVQVLAGRERDATAELIAHLAELDTRKILLAEGHSLFSYCRVVLHLSEHGAYNRIEAARAARRFPAILERLRDGSVNLTTVRLLAPHLTADNHLAVLEEAAGKSKRDVEVLIARLSPRPDVPAVIRALPVRERPVEPNPLPGLNSPRNEYGASPAVQAIRPAVVPLAPSRFALQVTLGQDAHDDLRRLQDLLCREIPNGDPSKIVERALSLLRKDVEKKKRAATEQPRRSRGTAPDSRDIAATVERAVWKRDGNRCAFIVRSGRRCAETKFLDLHHTDPYALGGEKTPEKMSVRCRRHNVYESELIFGPYNPSVVREAPIRDDGSTVPERVRHRRKVPHRPQRPPNAARR